MHLGACGQNAAARWYSIVQNEKVPQALGFGGSDHLSNLYHVAVSTDRLKYP